MSANSADGSADLGGRGYSITMDPASLGLVMEEIVMHPGSEVQWHDDIGTHFQASPDKYSLCRMCAEAKEQLVPIFEGEGLKLQLEEKMQRHLPINVTQDDRLPLQLCLTCIGRLNQCHEIADLCLTAKSKLESMFCTDLVKDETNLVNSKDSSVRRDELVKGVKLLRQKKKGKIPEVCDSSSHVGSGEAQDSSGQESFEAVYLNEDALNEYKEQHILDIVIEAVEGDSLPPGMWTTANLQVKMPKNFNECSSTLKSQIVGAIQEIMIEEDQVAITNKKSEGGKRSKSEWKCDICGHIAPRQSSLLVHQRRTHSKPFACSYCYKTFTNGVARLSHERSHKSEPVEVDVSSIKIEEIDSNIQSVYMCEHCGLPFVDTKGLINHLIDEHSGDKRHKCDKCEKSYSNPNSLDIHKATHSLESPFLCDVCGKEFKHKSNLRSHKRSHLGADVKNGQVCKVCGKRFRSLFHLNEHNNIHENRKPYSCDVCAKKFHKKIQLRQHGSTHLGVQPFHCPVCGIRFNRRGNMTQHLKRHERQVKYTCKVCTAGFTTLGTLLQHRKTHSKEELDNAVRRQLSSAEDADLNAFKCNICHKLLAKKDSLTLHMRSHSGEKPYTCEICGKKLSNKGSLTYHMRSYHTGERPHSCQFCNEAFLTREAMIVHERIHTGEKPFVCEVCFMGFRCSSNLAQHVKVHSSDRPHQCPHCEKSFLRKGALTVHLRVHTGERPFICDQCGRGFTQKNDMLKHRRTHTQERPFPCPECGMAFTQKRDLTKHQMFHMETVDETVVSQGHTVVITTTEEQLMQTFDAEVIDNAQSLINVLQF